MLRAIILEDTDSVFTSLEGMIRRTCKKRDVAVSVHHRRSKEEFEAMLGRLSNTPTFLIICDIQDRKGASVQALRSYIETLWLTERTSWLGQRPIIVFSRNDVTYKQLKKHAQHHQRVVPSAVISQTPSPSHDSNDDLKQALVAAIQTCNAQPYSADAGDE